MQVLFIKDVGGVGKRGDVKTVSDGYALNALIPKGFAIQATADVLKTHAEKLKTVAASMQAQKTEWNHYIEKLSNTSLTIASKANEKGHLYQEVTPKRISELIAEKLHIDIQINSISVAHPIKQRGEHTVVIALGDKKATLKLIVNSQA